MDRTRYTFFINERQRDGLRAVKERDGISESEQIRQAINDWLSKRGVAATKAKSPRGTRKVR
jgi:hypothetical protein